MCRPGTLDERDFFYLTGRLFLVLVVQGELMAGIVVIKTWE